MEETPGSKALNVSISFGDISLELGQGARNKNFSYSIHMGILNFRTEGQKIEENFKPTTVEEAEREQEPVAGDATSLALATILAQGMKLRNGKIISLTTESKEINSS